MGADPKSLISQAIEPSSEPAALRALSLDFSPIADLREIRRLSQFLPVIVLVTKSASKDQAYSSWIVAAESTTKAREKKKLRARWTKP